jgi:hypothetical protein
VERAFDASCDRWHTLYRAALSQRVTQNKIIGDASCSQRDKDQARRLRREAEAQLDLLISEADGVTFSNFYSYRYFASEGFFSATASRGSAFVPGSGRRHAPRAREDCEAACYDCLMSYTNQMDHPILDRQSIRNLLSQLTGALAPLRPSAPALSTYSASNARPDPLWRRSGWPSSRTTDTGSPRMPSASSPKQAPAPTSSMTATTAPPST